MRKSCLLFLAFICISSTLATCPSGTVPSFDGTICWLMVSVPLDFISAEQYCKTNGGHLASLHSAFDNIYLADIAKKQFVQAETFMTGGNNLQNKLNWTWIDGSNFDFTDWANYEPQNVDVQNCLVIDVGHALWHTADCFVRAPFVCSVTNSTNLQTTTTTENPNVPTPAVGNSTAYEQASEYFASVLNPSVNPCDDFYNYTCGIYNQPMTFDSAQMTIYNDFYAAYNKAPNANAPLPVKLVNHQYSTCYTARSNWGNVVNDGSIIKSIVSKFSNATKFGFPAMDGSVLDWPDSTQLGTALGMLSGVFQTDTLVSFFVDTNWVNNSGGSTDAPNPYILYLDQPVLTLSWTYYIGSTWNITRPSLYNYVNKAFTSYAQVIGKQLDSTQLAADINAILDFEHLLANSYSTDATTRWQMQRNINFLKTSDFSIIYSFLDIQSYFSHLAASAPSVMTAMLDDNFVFDLMEPQQLTKLDSDFKGFKNTTVPRTLYNYFYYRLLLTYSDYFPVTSKSAELQDDIDFLEMMEYKKPKLGRPKFTESRRTRLDKIAKAKQGKDLDETAMACIDDTVNYFDDASTRVLVDQIYPTQANKDFIKTNVGNLAQTIMIGMQSMIDGLNWMTPQTKAGAYAKISQLTRNIAYPDYVVDDAKLTAHYSDLDNFINETNYYNILSSLQKFTVHNSLMNLLKTTGTDRHDFNGPAGIVNAWYQPEQNSITFPAGILRMPFYDPDWPKSVVLGAMGMVAGHELSHGFDSSGTQYDASGNLHTWMDAQSQAAFNNMTQCVINEYNGFCPLDSTKYTPNCINGQQTVGENVADNAGIHSAFRAYKTAVDYYGEDPRLPGPLMSQFNHDQLFFLSFARLWCEHTPDPNREYRQILVDPHSPSKYRVFGSLQNYPAFRNAYNCPVNSTYAPDKHCNVWVSAVGST